MRKVQTLFFFIITLCIIILKIITDLHKSTWKMMLSIRMRKAWHQLRVSCFFAYNVSEVKTDQIDRSGFRVVSGHTKEILLIKIQTKTTFLWRKWTWSWNQSLAGMYVSTVLCVIFKQTKKYSSAIILVLRYKRSKFLKFHYCWKQSTIKFIFGGNSRMPDGIN